MPRIVPSVWESLAWERLTGSPSLLFPTHTVTWQRLIQKHGGIVTTSLDVSALAKVSEGYSQGNMAHSVQAVLTERRLLQLPKKPLVANELLQMLARSDPIYPEEEMMLKVPALHPLLPGEPALRVLCVLSPWSRGILAALPRHSCCSSPLSKPPCGLGRRTWSMKAWARGTAEGHRSGLLPAPLGKSPPGQNSQVVLSFYGEQVWL